jgi:phosphatidyl-myo-inositol dimannoside synthase
LTPRTILFLVPDLWGRPGGIARHGRLICRTLSDAGIQVTGLALHDARGRELDTTLGLSNLDYRSYGGNRPLFIRDCLTMGRRPYDLVIVEHPSFSHLGWVSAQLLRARFIVFGHGIDIWDPLSLWRRLALQRADRVICVSRFTSDQALLANGLASERMRVLHNCLDPQFTFGTKPVSRGASLSLLTVSRLALEDPYKGHQQIIRALPELLQRFPGLMYRIVGDGDLRPTLEALAEQEGVSRAVSFHGFVSDEALAGYYADASLFVMPSRSEGFGFTFLEAMAHGTPAIGGGMDAAREVIVDGETGYIVDPTSIDEIKSRITQLLADEALRMRMGQAAMDHVARTFSYEQFARQLLSYVDELYVR